MEEAELDKSESATPFKLKRAREKGSVARGLDLGFLAVLMGFLGFAWVVGAQTVVSLARLIGLTLSGAANAVNAPGVLLGQSAHLFTSAFGPLLAFAATVFAVVLLLESLQVGPVFSTHVLKPDFNRINPVQGLKRLLSWRLAIEAVKSIFKLGVYGAIAWLVIAGAMEGQSAAIGDGQALMIALGGIGFKLLLFFALAAAFFAAADQLLARREFARKMRMSRRELKRENRDREGDQRLKQKRKEFHNEFIKMAKSLRAARDADVILTNPTHVAVALRYRAETMEAPTVISRGSGALAARIKRVGFTYGVTVVPEPALARALFKRCKLDAQIPDDLFQPVADIYRRFDLVAHGAG